MGKKDSNKMSERVLQQHAWLSEHNGRTIKNKVLKKPFMLSSNTCKPGRAHGTRWYAVVHRSVDRLPSGIAGAPGLVASCGCEGLLGSPPSLGLAVGEQEFHLAWNSVAVPWAQPRSWSTAPPAAVAGHKLVGCRAWPEEPPDRATDKHNSRSIYRILMNAC